MEQDQKEREEKAAIRKIMMALLMKINKLMDKADRKLGDD